MQNRRKLPLSNCPNSNCSFGIISPYAWAAAYRGQSAFLPAPYFILAATGGEWNGPCPSSFRRWGGLSNGNTGLKGQTSIPRSRRTRTRPGTLTGLQIQGFWSHKPSKAPQELMHGNSDILATRSEKLLFTKELKPVKQMNVFLINQQLSHQNKLLWGKF